MPTDTPEKVSSDNDVAEVQLPVNDSKLHGGPVSRILSQVAKMHGDYIDYKMEAGIWRKLAL